MEIKDNKITFELDERQLNVLKLSSLILNKDIDELFKDFIERTSYNAIRSSLRESSSSTGETRVFGRPRIEETQEERMKRRIEMWARRPSYVNYNIIKAYFLAKQSIEDQTQDPSRDDILNKYLTLSFVHEDRKTPDVFLRNFTMMCSNAAYGAIFVYNSQTGTVKINDLLNEYLNSRKEYFDI